MTTDEGYTLEEYQQIKKGMEYEEVIALLGQGTVTHSTDFGAIYEWKNVDGSYILVNFSRGDGKLVSHSQFGLKKKSENRKDER